MKILTYANGPFMVNSYLIINESSGKGIVIDPGSDIDHLINDIKKDKIDIEAIICTHAHIDHVAGVALVKNNFNVPFYLNELEIEIAKLAPLQAKMFGLPEIKVPPVDKNLPASGNIEIAGIAFKLYHTPGHSPGSVSLHSGDTLFSGDSLFNLSIGRTDLPGGDFIQLVTGIREKLFVLPDETRVLCGHGPETTIGYEKEMNPFFR